MDKKYYDPKILSEERVSINLLKEENDEPIKSEKYTKGHLLSETYYCPEQEKNSS